MVGPPILGFVSKNFVDFVHTFPFSRKLSMALILPSDVRHMKWTKLRSEDSICLMLEL